MKKNKRSYRAGGLTTIFVIGVVITALVMFSIQPDPRQWTAIADNPLGAGAGGFLMIGTIVHSGTPETTYATNISNSSFYEFTDTEGSVEMTGETPSDTAFDFVFKFRTNTSQNWASNNATWVLAWVRGYMDIDFDFATDVTNQQFNIVEIANNSEYAWYYCYAQDTDGGTGSGFTIANNEKFTINWFRADYYG